MNDRKRTAVFRRYVTGELSCVELYRAFGRTTPPEARRLVSQFCPRCPWEGIERVARTVCPKCGIGLLTDPLRAAQLEEVR